MPDKKLCPVCGKVVGAWHKTGVHPKCAAKQPAFIATVKGTYTSPKLELKRGLFDPGAQTERDKILRAISGPPKERTLRR